MIEIFAAFLTSAAAKSVGIGMGTGIAANLFHDSGKTWWKNKKRKGKDGLPANHHLRNASLGALSDAIKLLATTLMRERHPDEVARWFTKKTPEDKWITALKVLSKFSEKKPTPLADFHDDVFEYDQKQLGDLFGTGEIGLGKIADRLHEKFADWAAEHLPKNGEPDPDLKSRITDGWQPIRGGEPITLYAAYAWFFRMRLKFQPEVFRIFTADTLADLGADAGKVEASLADFEIFLKGEIGGVWEMLDSTAEKSKGSWVKTNRSKTTPK